MKLLHLTSAVAILVVLAITLVNSSPLQRLKRALEPQENLQDEDRMSSYTQKRVAPEQSTGIKSMEGKHKCLPGLWTCLHSNPMASENTEISYDKDQASSGEGLLQGPRDKRSPLTAGDIEENNNAKLTKEIASTCPPGIWVCGKKKRSDLNTKFRRALIRFYWDLDEIFLRTGLHSTWNYWTD